MGFLNSWKFWQRKTSTKKEVQLLRERNERLLDLLFPYFGTTHPASTKYWELGLTEAELETARQTYRDAVLLGVKIRDLHDRESLPHLRAIYNSLAGNPPSNTTFLELEQSTQSSEQFGDLALRAKKMEGDWDLHELSQKNPGEPVVGLAQLLMKGE